MREALIERSAKKALSELDQAAVNGASSTSASTGSARTPPPGQMILPTAQEIVDALMPKGTTVQSLIGRFKEHVTRDNVEVFISTVKTVARFAPETKLLTPLTKVVKSQKMTITDQEKAIDELQGRIRLLEKQVATTTASKEERQEAAGILEDSIKKHGEGLRMLREQINTLASAIKDAGLEPQV
jgi:hypothetical protein